MSTRRDKELAEHRTQSYEPENLLADERADFFSSIKDESDINSAVTFVWPVARQLAFLLDQWPAWREQNTAWDDARSPSL
jgi:hypothetical protein